VESKALTFGGIHCHIGSQVFRLDSYAKATAVVVAFADECERETGAPVPVLNLGGGLGARYLASDPAMAVDDEVFWGYDDFPYLDTYLAGKDPLPPLDAPQFNTRPEASAMRKQVQRPL
jgi:hypothetical protein